MVTRHGVKIVAAMLGLLLAPMVAAQTDVKALGKEIEALKAGQSAIRKELQEIKSLLQAAPQAQAPTVTRTPPAARTAAAPETVDMMVSVADAPIKGDANAKVTVVEFTDYQCPFCSRYFNQTWPQLEQDYVKTGKAKFVLRDLPLESIHPQAFKAAEATHCANEQGKFWEMHDRLFANQNLLDRKNLSAHAQALGLDVEAFDKCVDSNKGAARIRRDVADSEKAGARGTPIFFVGLTEPNSAQIKAVRVIRGAHPYAVFKDAIDSLLASAK
jgi:protein-disulfide isomerase